MKYNNIKKDLIITIDTIYNGPFRSQLHHILRVNKTYKTISWM